MKAKLLFATLLASLMMAGSTMAAEHKEPSMGSFEIEDRMQEIEEQFEKDAEKDRVKALENKVENLEGVIHEMMERREMKEEMEH